jgi:hypothetical protein
MGVAMFSIAVGDFSLICHTGPMPPNCVDYLPHARLVEEFDRESTDSDNCFLAVKHGFDWPMLVVIQRCRLPGMFDPHALLVPETAMLFLGVGERLLAYALNGPMRLWEDSTECGVWGWARHGEFILMSAELELAAWDIQGRKLWTRFVEPPWQYSVSEGMIHLDVMGKCSSFPIETGPAHSRR